MQSSNPFAQTIKWYNDNAQTYANKIEHLPELEYIKRFANLLKSGDKILDAGCAAGRDSKIFKDQGFEPTGIDIVENFIKLARKKNPNIEFVHGDFRNLPFSDNTFAGIWATACLLHSETTADVKKALNEFYRVLEPKGIIHISVKQQLDNKKTAKTSHQFSKGFKRFFRFFTAKEIKNYLTKAGFQILKLEDNSSAKGNRQKIKWIVVLAQKPE